MKKLSILILISIIIAGVFLILKLEQGNVDSSTKSKQIFSKFQNFKPAQRVSFEDRLEFNPERNKSFGILIWLRFKEINKLNQRTFILRKYEQEQKTGFALAFNQFEDGFYPQVFWTSKEEGNWLTFQKFKPQPHRWYGFLLTFTDDKYLGLHLLKTSKTSEQIDLENLGGYILADVLPANSAKLEVGSIGTKIFNGSIAKVSFYKSESNKFNLQDFITTLKSATVESSFEEYPSYDLEFEKVGKHNKADQKKTPNKMKGKTQ